MTFKLLKKVPTSAPNPAHIGLSVLIWFIGAAEALLIARFTLRLFAARPDNPAFALLFAITAPLRAPLAFLDAAQPTFGAVLEFSTLVAALLLPVIGYLIWIAWRTATARRA